MARAGSILVGGTGGQASSPCRWLCQCSPRGADNAGTTKKYFESNRRHSSMTKTWQYLLAIQKYHWPSQWHGNSIPSTHECMVSPRIVGTAVEVNSSGPRTSTNRSRGGKVRASRDFRENSRSRSGLPRRCRNSDRSRALLANNGRRFCPVAPGLSVDPATTNWTLRVSL